MSVSIHIPTPMRQHTEGQAVVQASGATVQAALDDMGRKFPGVNQRIFENGQVRRFINVYLNDEDIRYLDNLATAVKDGDELSIIPAVAGG
jgi:sulfur-carrier protein